MGFEDLEKSLHKKLCLQDIKPEIQQSVNAVKKVKVTVYLDEEAFDMLNEMCSQHVRKTGKQDKSLLLSNAVKMFYKKEYNL